MHKEYLSLIFFFLGITFLILSFLSSINFKEIKEEKSFGLIYIFPFFFIKVEGERGVLILTLLSLFFFIVLILILVKTLNPLPK